MVDTFIDINYTIPQSSPMVRFVEYASWAKKNQVFLRYRRLHAVRRHGPFSTVLQKPWLAVFLTTLRQMAGCSIKTLSPRRFVSDSFIRHCSGDRAYSKYPHHRSQWPLAFLAWPDKNSSSRYLAGFAWQNHPGVFSKPPARSRQNTACS